MLLVEYSDSEGEQDLHLNSDSSLKRKRDASETPSDLPPLPSSFHDLYSTTTRASTSDDPSLHDGRKRAVPHVEGNWATHVYLEWHPTSSESNILSKLITSISSPQASETIPRIPTDKPENSNTLHTLLQSPLGSPLPLHVSLSQPLVLQTLQREAFLDALVLQLRRTSVGPFTVRFTTLKWVANHERTRWFLVLGMERPHDNELNRLLDACNTVAERFILLPLYRSGSGRESRKTSILKRGDPSRGRASDHSECFHTSIAWSLNPPEAGMMDMTLHSEAVTARMEKEVRRIEVRFDAVKVKIGNAVSNVDLSARARENARGILG